MRLVADANVLVGRLLGSQGQQIVMHPDIELFIAAKAWEEALHELPKRIEGIVRQGKLNRPQAENLAERVVALVEEVATVVEATTYQPYQDEAILRVPSDPHDWPSVALALFLDAEIWTEDRDFFGCGLPVWTTRTLAAHLSMRDAT
jgi:predicted nucleic acid-binding protein